MTINVSAVAPFKLNVEHRGFYITAYDEWFPLVFHLPDLPDSDRAGLIMDIYYLMEAGTVQYSDVVYLVGQILKSNTDFVTWQIATLLIMHVESYMKLGRERVVDTKDQFSNWFCLGWTACTEAKCGWSPKRPATTTSDSLS